MVRLPTLPSLLRLALFLAVSCRAVEGQDIRLMMLKRYASQANWEVVVAEFGDQLNRGAEFILMVLEGETDLCELPNFPSGAESYHDSIGLLLPYDSVKCSAEQQALNALELQKNFSAVQYLVLYGTDPFDWEPKTFTAESEFPTDSIGVLYLPYEYYRNARYWAMPQFSDIHGGSEYFLNPDSADWMFRVEVTGSVRTNYRSSNTEGYVWFRYMLFSLLIVAACFRALYLWYAGGGRVHWRRNENGRITGILYVPPIPLARRFAAGTHGAVVSDTLTEEQFQNLPEIVYVPPETDHGEDDERDSLNEVLDRVENVYEPEIALNGENFGSILADEIDLEKQTRTQDTEDLDVSDDEDEDPANGSPTERQTTCTMCSICIDDFEAGEKLVLLPRCRHAFHRDCIRPWLLERQGCCPLCKADVLEGNDETDQSADSLHGDEEQQEQPDQNNQNELQEPVPEEEQQTRDRSAEEGAGQRH